MINTVKISEWIYDHHFKLTLIAILSYFVAASGLYFAEYKADFRANFKDGSDLIKTVDSIDEQYEKGQTLVFYLKLLNSGNISAENISVIEYADDLASTLPYVRYVQSLTSYQKPFSDDKTITAKYLGDWAREKNGLQGVNQYIAQQPQLIGGLIADDYSGAIVLAQLDLPEPLYQSTDILLEAAKKAVKEIQQAYPDIEVHLSGTAALDAAFRNEFMNLVLYAGPAIILFVSLTVAWLVSSLYIAMSGLTTAGITLIAASGIFGWLPIYFDQTAIMSVFIVMLLTVLDCIHIQNTYLVCLSRSLSKEAAIKESIRANLIPVFFTTLTTGVGLTTMLLTGSPPYVLFAQIALVGIFLGFAYSFTLLTSFAIWLPEPSMKNGNTRVTPLVIFVKNTVVEKAKWIIGAFAVLISIALALIPLNVIDEDPSGLFAPSNEFDIAFEAIRTDFNSDNQILVDLRSTGNQSITSPAIMMAIDEFEYWLGSDPAVVQTFTVNDVIKEIKSIWDNQPSSIYLPQSRQEYEQLLLVYELSLQAGQSVSEFIAPDRSQTLMTVYLEDHTNHDLLIKKQDIESWWAQQNLEVSVSVSGRDVIYAQLAEETVRKSLIGAGIAGVLITLFMIVSFRSIKWGFFSLIPNFVPFILLFGLWALLSGEINQATCMGITLVIGIVVDDSIHFITKFKDAVSTMDYQSALEKTYDFVGSAITIGSAAFIVNGILISISTDLIPNLILGAFLMLAFALAWLCDMLLMPAILVVYYQRKEKPLTLEPSELKRAA